MAIYIQIKMFWSVFKELKYHCNVIIKHYVCLCHDVSTEECASCLAVMFDYFDASYSPRVLSGVLKTQIQSSDITKSFHVSAHANYILVMIRHRAGN